DLLRPDTLTRRASLLAVAPASPRGRGDLARLSGKPAYWISHPPCGRLQETFEDPFLIREFTFSGFELPSQFALAKHSVAQAACQPQLLFRFVGVRRYLFDFEVRVFPGNRKRADFCRDAHVAVRGRFLHDLDRAGVVDPVADIVLIKHSIRDGRRKVIEALLQQRQIQNEIHTDAITRAHGRQLQAFESRIRTRYVFSKTIPDNEADIRLRALLEKIDRDANADAVALHDCRRRISFAAEDADAANQRFSVSDRKSTRLNSSHVS